MAEHDFFMDWPMTSVSCSCGWEYVIPKDTDLVPPPRPMGVTDEGAPVERDYGVDLLDEAMQAHLDEMDGGGDD